MKKLKFFYLFSLCLAVLFTSCTEDESLLTQELNTESRTDNIEDILDLSRGNQKHNEIAKLDNDVLKDWTNMMLSIEKYATGMRPNATARSLAYIYMTAYEVAVPGMRDYESNSRRLSGLKIRNNISLRNVDFEIALSAALSNVIDHFIYNLPEEHEQSLVSFSEQKLEELSAGESDKVIENSIRWANYVSEKIIEFSQTDIQAEEQILEPQPLSYEPPTGDGFWTYSADPERALFPYWESVRTFVIAPEETSTIAPIDYSETNGSPYFNQMMEAYNANNEAKEEDGEQLWIAEFWSDDVENLMISPPARQISIANQLIDQYESNLEEALVLFLKLGFSLNDAAVSTWKYKYQYMVMRPSVYIQEFIDPSYQTNLYRLIYWPNPGFPGYPSGHSCFASAASGLFIDAFGDEINFTDRTHEGATEYRGAPRTFTTFSDMAKENAYSRIPFGVHIKMDCIEGLRLGYEISGAVNKLKLKRHKT
jgi:hypothetical protein